jgi:GntR family transcriptional regulator
MPALPMTSAQIVEDLSARIASGEYGPPGTQLPTYHELARLYSVGFTTIAGIVRILRDRGVVVGISGRGTYVAGPDHPSG